MRGTHVKNYIYTIPLLSAIYSVGCYAYDDLSSCSQFIPDNHNYHVIVKYDFINKKEINRFVGITDKNATELSTLQKQTVKPFVDCIKDKLK